MPSKQNREWQHAPMSAFTSNTKAIDYRKMIHAMSRKLKFLALSVMCISLITSISGCRMMELKKREILLSQQEQEFKVQRQKIDHEQQLLKLEGARLNTLKITLDQERNRLNVIKKSPDSRNVADIYNATAKTSLVLVGGREHAYLSPPGLHLTARIDTGAKTSSLNAQDMIEFERDGKPYVRFNITNPNTSEKIAIVRRLRGHIKIKEHQGEAQSRPIVKMRVRIGSLDQRIKMTLADRSEFKNQILIGRNFLRDFAIVDVSKIFLSEKELPTPAEVD